MGGMTQRKIIQITSGIPASDGAGVKLTRIIATADIDHIDPLLLLDRFESDNPDDYIAGFPPHPHRGFETVTYMLAGRMRHKDSVGNEGVIGPGGVQWMRAAKGIIHSEMPEQQDGLLRGFQLWINLPASHKMSSPSYQEFSREQIPLEVTESGGEVRVITGTTDRGTVGPVINSLTEPLYLDVSLTAGEVFSQTLPKSHNAVIYMIDGEVGIDGTDLCKDQLGIFGDGARVSLSAASDGARFLLIAGKRLEEPVARGGPFVMNTKAEILEAFRDMRAGRLAEGGLI